MLPFITAPYLTRVLGVEGIGVYAFSYSVASYFLLFTTLGMANHGNRSVAASPRDRPSLGVTFINNYVIQLVCGAVVFGLYLGYCSLLQVNRLVALIQALIVLSGILDINWLYFGLEEFRLTVTRNAACKILGVVAIFVFVRNSHDLWAYALIMALSLFASQAILWWFLPSRVKLTRPSWAKVKRNIRPTLILFVPILSYSVYMIMDKIQIGALADMANVAYYTSAEKIMNIPVGIVTALGAVMLPRATAVLAKGNSVGHMRYLVRSFTFVSVVVGFICFGISSTATLFAPLYFGDEFRITGDVLQFLIFAPLISGWANVIRTQYLIPKFMDAVYVVSTVAAAIINFTLNLLLIPVLQAKGAVIGTLSAELAVLLIQAFCVRRELPWKEIASASIPYILDAALVFCLVLALNSMLPFGAIARLCIAVVMGTLVYAGLLLATAVVKKDDVYELIMSRIR